MKILVLENELSSRRGGQERSLLDVCQRLAKRGHKIILLYVTSGDLEDSYRQFCERLIRVKTYSVNRTDTIRSSWSFLESLWGGISQKIDMIYANQYLDSLLAGAFAKLKGVPFICHLRLPPPEGFCGQYRLGLSRTDHLIATSEQTRRDWVGRGFRPEGIDVVYNGIDISQFPMGDDREKTRGRLGIPLDSFVVTYAGRLHQAKGIDTLLKAFSLKLASMDARLILSGPAIHLIDGKVQPNQYGEVLKVQAGKLGIEEKVIWINHCQDMPALFGASDVTVLPSLWSEPFGRILIESMACGTPAVGSRVGGIPEILRGEFSKFTFSPGQAEELADLLHNLKNWRKENSQLGIRCRQHVAQNFPLEKAAEQIEWIFQKTYELFKKGNLPKVVESLK